MAHVRAGKQIKQVAYELGINSGCLHKWVRQDRIDRGEATGVTTTESAELRVARKRIRELETELAIIRQTSTFSAEEKPLPRAVHPAIDRLVDAGIPVKNSCRELGVSSPGYGYRNRPTSPTQLRRCCGLIRENWPPAAPTVTAASTPNS